MELGKEYFGPLWSFVASNEITDIDYNGKEIWLTNIFNERFRANQQFVTQYMTPAFVEQFTQRIANVVSRQFNKRNPELEAETSELRVTILHESVAKSGRSISIRKTPPLIRLTAESAIAEILLGGAFSCTDKLRKDQDEYHLLRDAGHRKDGMREVFLTVYTGE